MERVTEMQLRVMERVTKMQLRVMERVIERMMSTTPWMWMISQPPR